jgi:hypothetical protein
MEGGAGPYIGIALIVIVGIVVSLIIFWKILKYNCFFHQTVQMCLLASVVLKDEPEKLRKFENYAVEDVPGKKNKALVKMLIAD